MASSIHRAKIDIWMPLYVADYLADTRHLSTEQHGAYLLLMMHEWRTGPLPDDSEILRRIAGMEKDAWSIAWGVLESMFSRDEPGRLIQKRLELERVKSNEHKAKAV